jgi:hypothetical protein
MMQHARLHAEESRADQPIDGRRPLSAFVVNQPTDYETPPPPESPSI